MLISRHHKLEEKLGAFNVGSIGVQLNHQLSVPLFHLVIRSRLIQSHDPVRVNAGLLA
ncbi:hypothetical protein C1G86_1600 [Dehalococcoides mccartyi]|uniref:Uncharacterized protein n=1 Tax=Dehalococcoides mccartyi TaxID=61435 RepID=A0A328EN62_9CHLR|nr:hypothetical protein C1G87_1631 [Dehalococcoides mccartyi]RAL70070.1 hypothetical protein C1G86_1600 [Dehalococcoides mccartyi]